MDKSIFYKLGLNDKEIEQYLYLIKNGVQTVKQISDKININRTTAYRHLDSLVKKGLAEWIIDERGSKIQATRPENLDLLLNYKKSDVQDIESHLPKFISELNQSKPIRKLETQVRYYKGQEEIQQMIWNTLRTQETMRSYAVLKRREFIDPKFEDEFERQWTDKKLKDRLITKPNRLLYAKTALIKDYRKLLDIRTIPEDKFYITNDIAIYNNIIAIISLEKDNLVGVEIENSEMTKTQKSIFDLVWDVASPIED